MIHKVYRSKNGNPFACVLSVGRATEEWEAVTCPDCLAHKVPPVSPRLDYILSSLRRAVEIGYPWSVSPSEAAALVAEVERLRAEVAAERAAVVAWLRDDKDAWHMLTWQLADRIESGEHRCEGGE